MADEGGLHLLKPRSEITSSNKVQPPVELCEAYVDLIVKGSMRRAHQAGSAIYKLAIRTLKQFFALNTGANHLTSILVYEKVWEEICNKATCQGLAFMDG